MATTANISARWCARAILTARFLAYYHRNRTQLQRGKGYYFLRELWIPPQILFWEIYPHIEKVPEEYKVDKIAEAVVCRAIALADPDPGSLSLFHVRDTLRTCMKLEQIIIAQRLPQFLLENEHEQRQFDERLLPGGGYDFHGLGQSYRE